MDRPKERQIAKELAELVKNNKTGKTPFIGVAGIQVVVSQSFAETLRS